MKSMSEENSFWSQPNVLLSFLEYCYSSWVGKQDHLGVECYIGEWDRGQVYLDTWVVLSSGIGMFGIFSFLCVDMFEIYGVQI